MVSLVEYFILDVLDCQDTPIPAEDELSGLERHVRVSPRQVAHQHAELRSLSDESARHCDAIGEGEVGGGGRVGVEVDVEDDIDDDEDGDEDNDDEADGLPNEQVGGFFLLADERFVHRFIHG